MITTQQDAIQQAIDDLSSWLLDHTEEVFEEEPEIDNIRSMLQEAQDKPVLTKKSLAQLIDLYEAGYDANSIIGIIR